MCYVIFSLFPDKLWNIRLNSGMKVSICVDTPNTKHPDVIFAIYTNQKSTRKVDE
jgi:hypothetical protein